MTLNPVQSNLRGRFPRYVAGGFDANDFERILPGVTTWDSWVDACQVFGDERIELAEDALERGRPLSAGEAFVQAAILYHFAQIAYFESDERKHRMEDQSVAAYKRGLALVDPPIERLEIPFDGIDLVGHLRMPTTGAQRPGCVFLLPGVDSSKEEMHTLELVFLRRGIATFAFEGPGQGEVRRVLPMIDDYERALSTAIDALQVRSGLDGDRIGVYGRSMGGYLAPKCAAHDDRIRAVVSAGGIYDLSYFDGIPEHVQHNFRNAWGLETLAEASRRARTVSLSGVVEQVRCPFLIVHSGHDKVFPPSGAYRMAEESTAPTQLVIYEEGTHVCDNITYKYRPLVADWMAEQLAATVAATD